MAVELNEENEHKAENINQESDESTGKQISILIEIFDIWTSGEQRFYTSFKKVDRKKLNEWVRKIKDIAGDIRTENTRDTNNLISSNVLVILFSEL
ncbi:Hypothetical predicted protein [Octopus vulgaris]|uniref:Uncharacterized protein n=1 Tax=Octopus vulgaris TaxID=6645 RepID=A0AA36ALU1_OCTVU|nr:Hypothetical predicted protein [Octopus vulgaris]